MTSVAQVAATIDVSQPGAIAWLDVSAENWAGRPRTGPLGMQITASRAADAPFAFHGARLRGVRCVWAASTVRGAELTRPARTLIPATVESSVHLLARINCAGSVFDPSPVVAGTLRVLKPVDEIYEEFETDTHLFTLNVPLGALGVEATTIRQLHGNTYDLSPLQGTLLRAATTMFTDNNRELGNSATLGAVDRYLAALAALLLRTTSTQSVADVAHVDHLRRRTDDIIAEQSGDPDLTPAAIASQLGISLRQLYRAFSDSESPAARIRRSRLERAAEILAKRTGPGEVERVAIECGFVSAEYFSRAFRREFGLSPRAYRSANRDAATR
ncbi:helix-turn-helix transcriptional regulator [uncultured Jatrophihabitans sp.]|uniref:helix-turn-helix transcriptional regulator n=1 Tax=uncultured Jatrophihabitans sp. TaxID=1610747 RepID=UPI0035CC1DA0